MIVEFFSYAGLVIKLSPPMLCSLGNLAIEVTGVMPREFCIGFPEFGSLFRQSPSGVTRLNERDLLVANI